MDTVVVLNSDMTFINVVTWKRALKLIDNGKVEVVKYSGKEASNFSKDYVFKIPAVIRLINFIKNIYKARIPFNKRNVVLRDKGECQYCSAVEKRMTIDHVVPLSRGGKSTWDNCVTACGKCNGRKGNRRLEDTNMALKKKPGRPNIFEFLNLKMESLGIKSTDLY